MPCRSAIVAIISGVRLRNTACTNSWPAPAASAVDRLEPRKHQNQLFDVVNRQPTVDAVERVRHRTDHVLLDNILVQLVNIRPQFLDHAKLLFADARGQNVDLAAVFREIRCHLAGEEHAR